MDFYFSIEYSLDKIRISESFLISIPTLFNIHSGSYKFISILVLTLYLPIMNDIE